MKVLGYVTAGGRLELVVRSVVRLVRFVKQDVGKCREDGRV